MVNIMDIYKSLNISIIIVKILKFVPDDLKTKTCVSIQLKNYLMY